MIREEAYPYTLEVHPCENPEGHFRWLIRERGKLFHKVGQAASVSGGCPEERSGGA